MTAPHNSEVKEILEALLFVAGEPVSIKNLRQILSETHPVTDRELCQMIEELQRDYEESRRSFQIYQLGGGFQIRTRQEFAPWLNKLVEKERERISYPALETLAIVAYKQPIVKVDIERIRGVNVDGVLRSLIEKGLIRVVGKKDMPGKPFLYGTSQKFLTHFGLTSLDDLPGKEEFIGTVSRQSEIEFEK